MGSWLAMMRVVPVGLCVGSSTGGGRDVIVTDGSGSEVEISPRWPPQAARLSPLSSVR